MAWFKVDDAFHSSKPVLKIPRRYRAQAVGLWILAGTWSAQEESDGFIPEYVLEELCGTPAIASHLVRAGLWIEVTGESQEGSAIPDGSSGVSGGAGWQFHNWAKYQPTREELEEKREKERIRKANYRMSQRDKEGTPAGRTQGHQRESNTPDPTRPDPTPLKKEEANASSTRGTRIPADFAVSPSMVAWARANAPGIDGQRETLKFINYWQAKSGKDATKVDWPATWRNWMLTAAERAPQGKPSTGDKMRNTIELGRALQQRMEQQEPLEIGA